MYIKNPTSAVIFRFICLFSCAYGLALNIIPFNTSKFLHMMTYFTILTNMLCFYVFVCCVFVSIYSMFTDKPARYSRNILFLKGLATMSIIVSCLVYHFILKNSDISYTTRGIMEVSKNDFFVHYLVPFVTTADFLLFQPKGHYKWTDPLKWMLFPLIYLTVIMFVNKYTEDYPYFFMNVKMYGVDTFYSALIALTLVCLVAGYGVVVVDKVLEKKTD